MMGDRKAQIEQDLEIMRGAARDHNFTGVSAHVAATSRMILRLTDAVWPQQIAEPDHQGATMTEKTPSILPTIGRHVHYVAHGSADGTYPSVCRVAIVTEVPTEIAVEADGGQQSLVPNVDSVSLCVLNPTGMFFSQDLPHADAKEMKGGTWHWPCEQRQAKIEAEDDVDFPLGQLAHGRFEGRKTGEVRFVHHGRTLAVVFGLEYGRGPITIEVQDIGPAEEGS